jgi:hypothetical protein
MSINTGSERERLKCIDIESGMRLSPRLALGQALEPTPRRSSASRSSTTSSADTRLEGTVCQHCSTISQIRSAISRWSDRDGLAPFTIEYVAAISVISKNGGRPVRTCLE